MLGNVFQRSGTCKTDAIDQGGFTPKGFGPCHARNPIQTSSEAPQKTSGRVKRSRIVQMGVQKSGFSRKKIEGKNFGCRGKGPLCVLAQKNMLRGRVNSNSITSRSSTPKFAKLNVSAPKRSMQNITRNFSKHCGRAQDAWLLSWSFVNAHKTNLTETIGCGGGEVSPAVFGLPSVGNRILPRIPEKLIALVDLPWALVSVSQLRTDVMYLSRERKQGRV
eukprot:jgi/Bigna1/82810/fgenesh1_pg.97_\